jgi:hypothetical protein
MSEALSWIKFHSIASLVLGRELTSGYQFVWWKAEARSHALTLLSDICTELLRLSWVRLLNQGYAFLAVSCLFEQFSRC